MTTRELETIKERRRLAGLELPETERQPEPEDPPYPDTHFDLYGDLIFDRIEQPT